MARATAQKQPAVLGGQQSPDDGRPRAAVAEEGGLRDVLVIGLDEGAGQKPGPGFGF